MRTCLLYVAIMASAALSMDAADLTGTLTFDASQVGQSTRLGLVANGDFQVDWGDGTLVDYSAGSYYTETLKGQTMKLYGDFKQIVANSVNIVDVNLDGCHNMVQLQMNYNQFPTLNVSHMTQLTGLYAEGGKLKNLDVASCAAMRVLDVSENEIQGTLDCSTMSELTKLDCGDNQLTAVLLPKQDKIYQVDVRNNQLATLDVTGLSAVTELDCQGNQLQELDLTGMSKLEDLYAYENQISAINISGAPALETLSLSDNKIAVIDLTQHTKLEGIHLTNNNLNEIDLSKNTGVRYLNIGGNNLTTLDTKNLSMLSRLTCENNQLTELDLTGNANLYILYADHNLIEAIDMSQAPLVYDLNLAFNKLTELDLSKHNLYYVQVNDNELATLDLSSSSYLYRLAAQNNQLTDITFKSLNYLQGLTIEHNHIAADHLNEIINGLPDVTGLTVNDYNSDYAKIFRYDALPGVDASPAEAKGWIVTGFEAQTGVNSLSAEGHVVHTIYYGINGIVLDHEPESGIFIAREMMSDGQSVSRKVVK